MNHDPERVRRRRVAAGLNGQALARRAGISKGYLWKIERGESVASPEILAQIAAALGCTIEDLMPSDEMAPVVKSG